MSSEEERQLLAQINKLTNKINRHKSQQQAGFPPPSYPYPSSRGRGGSYRVSRPPYRSRSLVLNNTTNTNASILPSLTTSTATVASTAADNANPKDSPNGDSSSSSPSSQWVLRKNKHLQLINPNAYQDPHRASPTHTTPLQSHNRAQPGRREETDRAHFQHSRNPQPFMGALPRTANGSSAAPSKYEIEINGIRFFIAKSGAKLIRAPGCTLPLEATPKTTEVAGVKFFRTKNGNLFREGFLKEHQKQPTFSKTTEPCKRFSMSGSCSKGPRCRYVHDPSTVAVCREFLQKGSCTRSDYCDLSHDLTPERTPTCLHYMQGHCTNADCVYAHSVASLASPICSAFGFYGYCHQGDRCPDRHVFECPNFSNTGTCNIKRCKLLHRERANMMRKQQQQSAQEPQSALDKEDTPMTDLDGNNAASSGVDDDTESIDSDDLDEDEVEEFFGDDNVVDDFAAQRDYISLG